MSSSSNQKLYEVVKELGVIDNDQLEDANKESIKGKTSLADILLKRELVSDENLGKVIADSMGMPFIQLSQVSITDEILRILPETVAKKQGMIVFDKHEQNIHVAMSDPTNISAIESVKRKSGLMPIVHYATHRDIINTLALYSKDAESTFDDIISENIQKAQGKQKAEPPIIKIVDTIIQRADQSKASDIHIEPTDKDSLVRLRIDGVLHDIVTLPLELHSQVVTRIKVLARLRTDEHQAAQDGKIQFETEHEELDIRVSIVPITEGEKIVMRLLSERSRQFSLADLGLAEEDLKKVNAAYKKPHGMILSTGPTGSGKTTTLYSILKLLNKRDVNIMTIEDPVEYNMDNVNQIQVNSKTKLTFAAGLRSIVRQDPDIILVGEIRDDDTAGIAVNSSMTGHLVLSTLHTNDAATAIPRLIDMKIEPFLVGSTVNIIIAQRLVRKIHEKCRASIEITKEEVEKHLTKEVVSNWFGKEKKIRVYQGKGCDVCHQTGYSGRVGIFEVLIIDDEIREAIIDRKDASTIHKIAMKNGMTSMQHDGLEKVKQGATTIEEIVRVTKE